VEGLKGTLGYDNAFAVSSSGRSGGLGLYWNKNTKVEILPFFQYHIDSIIYENGVSRGDLHVFMAKLKLLNATKHGIC